MTMKQRPPFRADHIGSLLRPQELIEARHKLRDKTISETELHEIEDRAIRDVIKLQEDVGLQCVTDGEFRRGAFFSHFIKTVDGMTVKETPYTFANDSGDTAPAFAPYTKGKLRRAKGITTDEFKSAQALTGRTVKVTLPAPPYVNFLGGRERVDAVGLSRHGANIFAILPPSIARNSPNWGSSAAVTCNSTKCRSR